MYVITRLQQEIFAQMTVDLTRRWSIRELAAATGHHYRPIYLAVQQLREAKYLERTREGLLAATYEDTALLEAGERCRQAPSREIEAIRGRLREDIPSSFYSLVLFGSSVRRRGRDVDLLLIVPCDSERFEREARRALGSFEALADLHVAVEESALEMLDHPNQLNVMNEVLKNHQVLIGAEGFYRLLRRWKHG